VIEHSFLLLHTVGTTKSSPHLDGRRTLGTIITILHTFAGLSIRKST
jgi:hypothetical protein